jgi:hypothetical protein
MNARLFWKALAVQSAAVLVLFAILVALPLGDDFFEDYGFALGPVAWIACSFVTARVLDMPLAYVLFSAAAGGVAGLLVFLVAGHWAGMAIGLLVFAASCGSYDPDALEEPVAEPGDAEREPAPPRA